MAKQTSKLKERLDNMERKQNCGEFADAVCIDAGKVYDSCMDKDCAENIRVYFSNAGQRLISEATACRVRCAEVIDAKVDVEPVAFNRGYYSCDVTYCIAVTCEVQNGSCASAQYTTLLGLCQYSKRVILCGGEGAVKTFTSRAVSCGDDSPVIADTNLPRCTVQTVDPVVLDSKICRKCENSCCCCFPRNVLSLVGGDLDESGERGLYVTLGIFSIVQLVRNVQMLVPVYDFCIPEKPCSKPNESPCDVFRNIEFPREEFFPDSCDSGCGCGCASD